MTDPFFLLFALFRPDSWILSSCWKQKLHEHTQKKNCYTKFLSKESCDRRILIAKVFRDIWIPEIAVVRNDHSIICSDSNSNDKFIAGITKIERK